MSKWNGDVMGMEGEGELRRGSKAVGCKVQLLQAWMLFLLSASCDLSTVKCQAEHGSEGCSFLQFVSLRVSIF